MKTQPYLLTIAALCLLCFNSFAGNKLPVNAKGEAVYKHAFMLQDNVMAEDAYNMATNWLNANASAFTCQNIEDPVPTSCKTKLLIDDAFKNTATLQSQDPKNGVLSGKGLIKYYGTAGTGIGALYMEYKFVIEIGDHEIIATVSNIKYHHYNPSTYTAEPIYTPHGGKFFDAADNLENMVNEPGNNNGVQDVGAFVNKKIAGLLTNLQSFLQTAQVLEPSEPSQAAITEE
jgi:hypothetical protein